MRTTVVSGGSIRSMDDPGGLTLVINATGTSLATTTSFLPGLDNWTRSTVIAIWTDVNNNVVVLPNNNAVNGAVPTVDSTITENMTTGSLEEFEIWAVGPNGQSVTVLINGSADTFVDGSISLTIPCGTMKIFRQFGNVLGTGKHLWAVK